MKRSFDGEANRPVLLEAGSDALSYLASCEVKLPLVELFSFQVSALGLGENVKRRSFVVHSQACGSTTVAMSQEKGYAAWIAASGSLSFPQRERAHRRKDTQRTRPVDATTSSCV